MESWEHARGSSPARAEHRKMSFNPIAPSRQVPSEVHKELVFQVSKGKRIGKARWTPIASSANSV